MDETRPLSPKMLPEIHHWDSAEEGPFTGPALIRKFKAMGYDCAIYNYPPGTCFPDHSHSVDKIDAVLAGEFNIRIFGKDIRLEPGDWVVVPKDTPHSAHVVGNGSVTSIDAVRKRA